jgi:hypothetical protein
MSRFAAPLLALPNSRMKSEPLLKGQPRTSPEVFAWRTTVAGAKRHSSTAASVVIEDRSAGSAASCRILCRPSTMSCRAVIIAMTATRSPFTMGGGKNHTHPRVLGVRVGTPAGTRGLCPLLLSKARRPLASPGDWQRRFGENLLPLSAKASHALVFTRYAP